ncbi:Hypothetical predicted protein [Olea europaea subsp. europaea]|uniref:Histone acetyltransferase n=2 Tax=Olea europaea subsp. europaea TaxID=158383 RepID=A0A8S0VIG5_OLEEU|nr:Hypothetical predicted protein [Olea europaea subsp. europaea]
MPRPGPRPYECVRRAWHSHRHQPMRGIIIREIFRLVHENHCAATKKNKEWQEKLPIVALKAEEIMYSKANSEAEYMDLETLWDRVNDAIDTIIRKDESTETGELLPPCVEAALTLGCVAVRASRSQMHSNPRTYLRPTVQESHGVSPKVLDENTNERTCNLWPLHSANISALKKFPAAESADLVLESSGCVTRNTDNHIALSCEKLASPANNQILQVDSNTQLNVGSVYPLYYGTVFNLKSQPEVEVSRPVHQESQKFNPVIVGVPIYSSVAEPAEVGCMQNLSSCDADKNVTNGSSQALSRDKNWMDPRIGCDLSLRLGLISEPSLSMGKSSEYGTNTGRRVSQDRGKPRDKEFPFFPLESGNDFSRLHTSRWNAEGEGQNVEDSRKRKISSIANMDNEQFFLSQDPTSNCFAGRMKRPASGKSEEDESTNFGIPVCEKVLHCKDSTRRREGPGESPLRLRF